MDTKRRIKTELEYLTAPVQGKSFCRTCNEETVFVLVATIPEPLYGCSKCTVPDAIVLNYGADR